MTPRFFILMLTLALLVVAGCGAPHRPPEPVVTDLPDEIPDLLHLAVSSFNRCGPVEAVALSLAAAEAVLARQPDHPMANLHAARAAVWLLEFDSSLDDPARRELAGRGVGYAETALGAVGERVDTVFLSGALLGLQLEVSRVPGPVKLRKVCDAFERAVALDPAYDEGAPLRALGTLLVKAPSWPAGPGDVEQGIELLSRAAWEYPGHPANHFFLGEALLADGRHHEAATSLRRVMDHCERYPCHAMCRKYAVKAETLLRQQNR
jgi:tetratricopeptide (TPR) repeat protein